MKKAIAGVIAALLALVAALAVLMDEFPPGDDPDPTPTEEPTREPTATPTVEPTVDPTEGPTPTAAEPTATTAPTATPTVEPTATPTEAPTPTAEPTATPVPTVAPTPTPTEPPPDLDPEAWLILGDSISVMADLGTLPGNVTNASVGGETVTRTLARLDSVLASSDALMVGVALGTNDYPPAYDPGTLLDRLIEAGRIPVVATIPWNDKDPAGIVGKNNTLRTAVEARGAALWGPDLYGAFEGRTDLLRAPGDVHPNPAGIEVIRAAWTEVISGPVDPDPGLPNFDAWTRPSWGSGAIASPASDGKGAFRTFCRPGQVGSWDPIVTVTGGLSAHEHQFFGNLSIDASTTADEDLRGDPSTCDGGPLNATGYWMPVMYQNGQRVVPRSLEVYYKSPQNQTVDAKIPVGLRMISGYPWGDEWGNPASNWKCKNGRGGTQTSLARLAELAGGTCAGAYLRATIRFPQCWDGSRLDSPNHHDHMAFARNGVCPSTHPVLLPQIEEFIDFEVASLNGLSITSDGPAGTDPGVSLHADWMYGWDQRALDIWHQECVQERRSCAGGDLGNGRQLIAGGNS